MAQVRAIAIIFFIFFYLPPVKIILTREAFLLCAAPSRLKIGIKTLNELNKLKISRTIYAFSALNLID